MHQQASRKRGGGRAIDTCSEIINVIMTRQLAIWTKRHVLAYLRTRAGKKIVFALSSTRSCPRGGLVEPTLGEAMEEAASNGCSKPVKQGRKMTHLIVVVKI